MDRFEQAGGVDAYYEMLEFDAWKEANARTSVHPNTIIVSDAEMARMAREDALQAPLNTTTATARSSFAVTRASVPFFLSSNGNIGYFYDEHYVQQDNGYYCGPATLANMLYIINGWANSQSYYASGLGTTSANGTIVANFASYIDNFQSDNDYGWREILWDDTQLWNPIITDTVSYNVPLAVLIYTDHLSTYDGHRLNHYLTIRGFSGRYSGTKTIYYTDSWDDSGYGNNTIGRRIDTLSNFMKGTTYLIW